MSGLDWTFGREPADPETLVDGRTPESEPKPSGDENPLLVARRRAYELKRDIAACDYSIDSMDF